MSKTSSKFERCIGLIFSGGFFGYVQITIYEAICFFLFNLCIIFCELMGKLLEVKLLYS